MNLLRTAAFALTVLAALPAAAGDDASAAGSGPRHGYADTAAYVANALQVDSADNGFEEMDRCVFRAMANEPRRLADWMIDFSKIHPDGFQIAFDREGVSMRCAAGRCIWGAVASKTVGEGRWEPRTEHKITLPAEPETAPGLLNALKHLAGLCGARAPAVTFSSGIDPDPAM